MNKHAYRVIFSKNRGVMMAVSEQVSGHGGVGASTVGPARTPRLTLRRLAGAIALLFGAATPVASQIVADPAAALARRPLVESTANGRPLVRIATPSAAGVSHNQYSQYNVDPQGAVLNNAGKITQTQQGGYIDGNPNLAGGSARVILNEVTGTSASQLRGYTEVAGAKAEVVIANPNGISCNGCGFINASRGVLTTGTPVLGAGGALEGFRVAAGSIQIGAQGLAGDNMDQLDLIARSVEVNGALWGKQLNVIVGPNQVRYADLGVQLIEGAGAAPTVAIDVARLGGMYGDKIRLVGTEAGVGVNSGGSIVAGSGNLVIDSMGKLTLSGVARASTGITLHGAGGIVNDGVVSAGGDLIITGAGIASTGMLAAGVDAAGAVGKSGNLTVTVSGRLGATGSNIAGGQLALDGGSLDLSGAATEAGADMKLTARNGDIGLGARTVAAGNITITAKAGTVHNDAATSDASRMIQSATIDIEAAGLDNTNGTISQTGEQASAIRLAGKLANGGGSIASNGRNLTLESGTLDNNDGEIRHAGAGVMSVNVADLHNQRGAITGRGAIAITAASLDNTHGRVTAMGTDGLRVTVTGELTNIGMTAPDGSTLGQIGSNGATTVSAGTVRNSGVISATGALTVDSAHWLDNSDGKLLSDGLLTSTAGAAWTNTAGKVAGKQIRLTGDSLTNDRGLISQTGAGDTTINVHTGLLDNQHGTIESNGGKLTVTSGKLVNDGGVIDHAGDGLLRVDSGALSNLKGELDSGAIRSNGDIVITAAAVINGGAISAQKTMQLSATSLRNDGGTVASNAALTVRAGTLLTNVNGALHAGAASKPASASASASVSALTLDNSGGEISAGTLEIDAITLTNSHGLINQDNQTGSATFTVRQMLDNRAGEIGVAAADLTLAPTTTLRNDGGTITHTGRGMLTLGGGSLVNDGGKLGSNGQVLVTVGALSNRAGTFTAVGALDITSTATVDNRAVDAVAGVLAGSSVTVTANNGLVDNRGSIIEATDGLTLHAQSLDNSGGAIRNQGAATLTVDVSGAVVNADGTLRSRGDVNVGGKGIDNRRGAITADGSATVVSAAGINNSEGGIQALGNVSVNAVGDLHNAGGKIRALGDSGTLAIAAAGMDNAGGRMVNTGSGATVISAAGEVVNANPGALDGAGVIGGNGDVTVNAAVLRNGQNAKLAAGGALTLNTTALLDNSGGKLLAGGMLRMKQAAARLINNGGEISGQQVDLASASLDNTNGLISNPKGSGGNITVNTGALVNLAGSISSDQDLWLTALTIQGQGRIAGGRDATVRLQGSYTNEADNVIAANGTLTLSTTGILINAGTLAAAGNVTLNAAGISNLSGAVIASGSTGDMLTGATTLNAAGGEIENAGRIEGNTVNASSSGFHNSGSVIGDVVTIAADRIDNDGSAAIIAAVGQVNLWAKDALANRNGATLFSLGDMNMAADGSRDEHGKLVHRTSVIDNLSSTIEADGELQVAAEVVNNVRQNVRTESVLVEDRTYKLTPLPWTSAAAPNIGAPERNSNTIRLNAYYLDPKAIISNEPMITPDGYVIHKAVVNLNASDSVFQWMRGGLSYPLPDNGGDVQYASQSRLAAQSGTRVIYYMQRLDNQANPDKVQGSSAWTEAEKYLVRTSLGEITYSSNFGNCTSNCVRLETIPDYTDPASMLNRLTNLSNGNVARPDIFAVEVQRNAHQTITETRLAEASGAAAVIRSGGPMHLDIRTRLNNDNGQIAAGGNLIINDVQSTDGSESAQVRNVSTQLTRTYTFTNTSGFGTALVDSPPVREERTWSNPSITQPIGSAGGTIASNRAVVINARQVTNNSVASVQGPNGASPSSLGLGEDMAPYAGSAADRSVTRSGGSTKSVAASPGVAGAPGSAALPGTVRTVNGARAGALSPTLPSSGLYRIAPQPAQPYLVETDKRFTSYQNFISSDYQLERLGIRPEQTQKRLGDGFYEQRLVLGQASALAGKRYLAGHSNAEEEFIALMNSGVEYAQRFGLVPGIALSDTQMAALTSDMVWLAEQTVTLPDGSQQTVLVPQVYLARNPRVTPTGALIAGDAMQIGATDVDNRSGTLSGNRQLFISAGNDIDNSFGSIQGGNVRLHADKDIIARSQTSTERMRSGSSTSTLTSVAEVSRISATGNLVIDAGRDLTLQGAQISAGGNAGLAAGRRLSIGALETSTQYSAPGVTTDAGMPTGVVKAMTDKLIGADQARALAGPDTDYQSRSSHQRGSAIASGGDLAIVSSGDIAIEGSQLSSGRNMLVAGKDRVDIVNTTDSSSLATSARAKGYRGSDELHTETVNGSRLQAEGNMTVYAGAERDASGNLVVRPDGGAAAQDLTVRGSSIAAGMNPDSQGRATLRASGNVDIIEAGAQFDSRRESRSDSDNGWSSTQGHDIDKFSARTAQGSVITGTEVNVVAGRDLNLRGSAVAGSRDVALSAEGDINISAARERQAQYLLHEEHQDGVFASNGNLTLGGRSLREESNTTAVTESRLRSMVGSGSGDVSITAKGNVALTGSDVVAGRDVNLTGRNVYFDAGTDSSRNRTMQDSEQSGLSVTLSGAIPTAARAAGKALDRKVQSQDSRIAALQGVKAGMTINSYLDGVEQAEASDAANAASGEAGAEPTKKPVAVKVAVTAGSSESHSVSESRQQAQSGSSIVGVNKVNINATGSGKKDSQGHALDGDISGTGVQITGKNVSLDAARDIDIRAAQQSASNRSNSTSSSYGVGIGFAVGGNQNGVTVELAAATAEGRSNFDSITHQASQIAASNTLRMNSGRDMNLLGAQAKGDRVEMKVGRDLNIGSTQDREVLDVTQQSAGFNLSLCVPPICYGSAVEGSASYNRADTDSKYRSVQAQSGVYAGRGGYDIAVKGNTDLVGAVIASAAEPEHNRLKTGTLTMRDLDNQAAYSASSVGISATTSSGTGKAQGGSGILPNVGVSSSSSASGTSRSAISPGSIDITDEAGQIAKTGKGAAQTVADTNRDTATANGAIDRIFDQQKVQQQQELAQLVGEVGFQAAGMIAQKLDLADGSPEKIALHAAVGFLQAQAGGGNALAAAFAAGATEAINTLVADYLAVHTELSPSQRYAVQQWAAVVSGGVVGAVLTGNGTGGQTGAAVALDGERFNRQLHISNYDRLKDGCRQSSSTECQTINRMGGVRSGMPTDDAKIPASKVVENYDANGKVVSYTLIDRNSNQPTMIMEPLNYAAYRNAPAGTQALMQQSPQYALDFASAGLYSSAGDNGRAVEHVVAGVTSRDYLRDVGLGVAGAAVSAAIVAKPTAATAQSTTSSRGVPDAVHPEADFSGRGAVRGDLTDHLINPQVAGKQISGGHDMNEFNMVLNKAGGTVVSKVETGPGIYEIKYQLPNANKPAVKTVFDPIRYPNMEDMVNIAANRALSEYQLTGNAAPVIQINGISFDVRIAVRPGEAPSVRTAFPVGSAK